MVFGGWADRPALHEWIGVACDGAGAGLPCWAPPLGILLGLARRCLAADGEARRVVWIGRRCWPYPRALGPAQQRVLLERSIFVDPPDDAGRLWAIDLAARCRATAMVIADGSGLDMAATRRLQLAAEAGSAPVLCARPPQERSRLSAAATRWVVAPSRDADGDPRWIVELLRCKGVQPEEGVRGMPGGSAASCGTGRRWTVEWKRVQSGVDLHAALVDRPSAAPGPRADQDGPSARGIRSGPGPRVLRSA